MEAGGKPTTDKTVRLPQLVLVSSAQLTARLARRPEPEGDGRFDLVETRHLQDKCHEYGGWHLASLRDTTWGRLGEGSRFGLRH